MFYLVYGNSLIIYSVFPVSLFASYGLWIYPAEYIYAYRGGHICLPWWPYMLTVVTIYIHHVGYISAFFLLIKLLFRFENRARVCYAFFSGFCERLIVCF